MGSRREFTKEFKLSVIHQLGSRSAAEICRENNIKQNPICRWKKEYDSNPGEYRSMATENCGRKKLKYLNMSG